MLRIYKHAWCQAFTFTGRASRTEYWVFTLGSLAVAVPALIPQIVSAGVALKLISLLAMVVFFLAATIVSVSLTVRRLHDINQCGLWALLLFSPFLLNLGVSLAPKLQGVEPNAALVAITQTFSMLMSAASLAIALVPGTASDNKYGPIPTDGREMAMPSPEEYQAHVAQVRRREIAERADPPVSMSKID